MHEAEPDQPGAEEHSAAGRSPVGPLLVGMVMLALGVLMLAQTFNIKGGGFEPSGPRFMPFVVASLWTVLALIYLGQQVSRLVRRADNLPAERFTHMLGAAALVVLLVIYAYLLDPLGYVIATSLFFLGASRAMGSRQWFRDLIVAVALSLLVYLTFTRALGVHLPEGVLGL
ncbi:tripartite tricarboxylate transporter TctB family protein [Micromonospora sp. NPDC007230]|uniref:tripartite tricarboxylate transporter TctB family protein n=1 Tax=Micromonospora sp. NPDC007230 TaxID=3364237 RepID=UPI0036A0F76F